MRKVFGLLLAGLVALALVGCSDQGTTTYADPNGIVSIVQEGADVADHVDITFTVPGTYHVSFAGKKTPAGGIVDVVHPPRVATFARYSISDDVRVIITKE